MAPSAHPTSLINSKDKLQYRGQLDASRTKPFPNARRDLYEAMKQVIDTDHGRKDQLRSTGCSIKWKHYVAILTHKATTAY